MSLELDADITELRGAEYNPRKIEGEDLDALRESLRELGVVKPIIATRDGLIVAGHQRTRSLRAEGIDKAPVYWIDKASEYDAARFNQLHNGTDLDKEGVSAHFENGLREYEPGRFHIIPTEDIIGTFRGPGAPVRNAIGNLIRKHGPWGAVVATESGEVIHCAQYALASAVSLDPLTTFVIRDEDREKYAARLGREYGVFSYDHLERHTYIQSEAQMTRLGAGRKREARSWLWDEWAFPYLEKNPSRRILDFGCGRAEYVNLAARRGFRATPLEFFFRKGGGASHGSEKLINVSAVNRMVDRVLGECRDGRRYDAVICDSVLNSVDSLEAEAHVMNCLNLFTKKGGVLFLSGRAQGEFERKEKATRAMTGNQGLRVFFPDKDGLTASLREGVWFFQRFHTDEQIDALLERHGFRREHHPFGAKRRDNSTWQLFARKVAEVPEEDARAAVEHEFNMVINRDGKRLGRHKDALDTLF